MSVPESQLSSPARQAPARQEQRANNTPSGDYRVHVSGFPPYTRVDDLRFVFASYGRIKIKMVKRYALITFADSDSMENAIAHSKKVCVYGSFLKIRRHLLEPPVKLRDRFVRSKEKDIIIEPQKLNLSGDFHQQLYQLLEAVRLTQEEVVNISSLYTDLESALRTQWPDCCAVPYGSITTGLGIKSSDADCFVLLPEHLRRDDGNLVSRTKKILQQFPDLFTEVYAIPNAHTPIVKFFHLPTKTTCDVSFKTPLGSRNSRLVAFLLHADPRLLPLAVALKYWAKVHDLSGTGKMTNYALTMLLIFYLQHRIILPAVEWLQRDIEEDLVDGWNTAFHARPGVFPPLTMEAGVAELLGGFFEFYADFDFALLAVCPFLGHAIKKAAFAEPDTLPDVLERYKRNVKSKLVSPIKFSTAFCIQDPFQLCHNVGSCINKKLAVDLTRYFKFAAAAYQESKLAKCADFLKTILLNKPAKIDGFGNKIRTAIRFREFDKIAGDEWKEIIKNVIRILFEDICRATLERLEDDEEEKPNGNKEIERYVFTLTKAIWKRKRFASPYDHMNFTFLEKQIKISKEIMKTDKETLDLKMQLAISFTHSSRTTVVQIEYVGGNRCHFQEFGKMFHIMLKGWLFEVIKPFLPSENQTKRSEQKRSGNINNGDDSDSRLNELSDRLKNNCTTSHASH